MMCRQNPDLAFCSGVLGYRFWGSGAWVLVVLVWVLVALVHVQVNKQVHPPETAPTRISGCFLGKSNPPAQATFQWQFENDAKITETGKIQFTETWNSSRANFKS